MPGEQVEQCQVEGNAISTFEDISNVIETWKRVASCRTVQGDA